VDAASSKNVTNANVTLDTFIVPSAFCLHDLTFTFHNVVAVAGWDGLGSTGLFAQAAVGDPAGDCTSAAQAIVVTETNAAFTPADFYTLFNGAAGGPELPCAEPPSLSSATRRTRRSATRPPRSRAWSLSKTRSSVGLRAQSRRPGTGVRNA